MTPLVSCMIVTRDRPGFFRQALRCYAAQNYPRKELVVVDDGERPVGALCDGIPDVTYVRLKSPTPTGTKMNLAVEIGRGDIVQKFDDDDYYAPGFLRAAVARMRRARRPDTLVVACCFAVLIAGESRLYFSGHGWSAGGSMCFRRALWQRAPFRDVYWSTDRFFIEDTAPPIARVCHGDRYVVVRHGRNNWIGVTGYDSVEGYFRQFRHSKTIGGVVGRANAAFYRSLKAGVPVDA